jgi:hypothetical protein
VFLKASLGTTDRRGRVPLYTVARARILGTSPVVLSECLQSPEPQFPVRRTVTSSGALGQDLRCDCAFTCFPCGSPDGPSIAPRTLKAATKYPSLAIKRSNSRSHSRLYPSLARSPPQRPSHQLGTRSCEAPSKALPGERQEFQEPEAKYLAEGVKSHVLCYRPGPVQQREDLACGGL